MKKADMLLVNGRFLTMEQPGEMAEAVAIADGRILFVGTRAQAEAYVDADTQIVDLEGKVAAPGLIDCHTHPVSFANRFLCLNLRGVDSLEALLDMLRGAAAEAPEGAWIIGRGYDESKFREGAIAPSAAMLDTVTTEHPVYIVRTCGHVAVLNSCALACSGFTAQSSDPETGGHFFKDAAGNLTGMVSGSLVGAVPFPAPTEAQREWAIIQGTQAEYFRKGITATGDMGSAGLSFRILQKLDREGKLKLRIGFYFGGRRNPNAQPMALTLQQVGLQPGFGSEHFRFLGIKFVMDGSTGGRTAAFSQPYENEPENYGELYNDPDILREDVTRAAKAGLQISIHAIGDRAIEQALQSLEYAAAQGADIPNLRVRLEHLESPTPDQIRRIRDLNISVGLSSAFIYWLGDSHVSALGQARLVDAFPAKTLLEEGITVGCNTDCPVCDVNPMIGIHSMVNRVTEAGQSFGGKKQAIDRMQALAAYTSQAARLLRLEDVAGTLIPGKYADLVVFDGDYLAAPDETLKDISIAMTISGGEIVYSKA